jgi:TolA-binding protein
VTTEWNTERRCTLWVLTACLAWLGLASAGRAQELPEERSFAGALKLFQGSWYDQAEKEFGAFVAAFPTSTNHNQALLLQAQSRFQLKNFQGVIALLDPQLKMAGPQNDQFRYWLAQAELQLDRFETAAGSFADLLKECPASPLRLEASYGEAYARFKLGDTARTVELLHDPASAFQLAAKGSTNETVLLRGSFLLAEALFAQKNFGPAEQTLTELAKRGLQPEAEWQRQYLLARIELADRRAEAALLRATNLVAIASARTNALLQARSLTLKGEILEEKQEPAAAVQAYQAITSIPGVATDQKRQAFLKLVDVTVAQNQLSNAIHQLNSFLEQNPQDAASDLIRFTLGEVYLKQFYALTTSGSPTNSPANLSLSTNLLANARGQFDFIINQLTNSTFVGKACLDRGWCFWEEAQLSGNTAKLLESQQALQSALDALPKSFDQARARFKLADISFQLKDYTNALAGYRLLLDQYSDLPEAKEKLLDQALYQVLRASIASGDRPGAKAALDRLLAEFPRSSWSDDSLFLYGQALSEAGEEAKAHEAFADFQKRFPESPLLADVRLAIGRTYAKQADWTAAIQRYNEWLVQFTTNQARPQAEFERAWCYYQAGNQTNAFSLFTNIVQSFPGSPFTPLAKLWLGDYFLNQRDLPHNFENAETYYQLLFRSTNAIPVELARHAILMAAKAAFFRQGYRDAKHYLTNYLVNDPQLIYDPQVGPEAWFMLGDIELEYPSRDLATNKLAKFEDAINLFARVTNFYSGTRLAPLAMGKIANCHFQLAALNTNRYEMATNQYWQVINSPIADVATRSQAEVGLGQVLEKMAERWNNRAELLNSALQHYLDVVYSRRLQKGETPDPYWRSKAALAAGTLAVEQFQQFDQAEHLYQEMLITLPSLSATWEKKLESLRQQRPK